MLTSSVDGRGSACPGERVNYTCTVTERLILEWTAEPFIMHSNRLQFTSTTPSEDRALACSDPTSPVQCIDFDYHATLTSVSAIRNEFADMISTFRFTASASVNGTVVQCRGLTATEDQMASQTLNITGGLHTRCVYFNMYGAWLYNFEPVYQLQFKTSFKAFRQNVEQKAQVWSW